MVCRSRALADHFSVTLFEDMQWEHHSWKEHQVQWKERQPKHALLLLWAIRHQGT